MTDWLKTARAASYTVPGFKFAMAVNSTCDCITGRLGSWLPTAATPC